MTLRKLLREVRRQFEREGVACAVEGRAKSHAKLAVTHSDGRVQRLTVSSTPSSEDVAIERTVRLVRRFKENKDA